MRRLFLASAFGLSLFSACATVSSRSISTPNASKPDDEIELAVGGIASLGAALAGTPTVSDPNVVEVAPDLVPGTLRAVGLKWGHATVTIPMAEGVRVVRLNVASRDVIARLAIIRHLLSPIDGVTAATEGGAVIIEGELIHPESAFRDFDRIVAIQRELNERSRTDPHGFFVVNLVGLSARLYEEARRQMQLRIDEIPGAQVRVSYLNEAYLVTGTVEDNASRDRVEAIVQALLPPFKANAAVLSGSLTLGAKRYAIRNLVQIPGGRAPASACPKL